MSTQKTKFTVGLFVASGIGIALIAFIWLGMSRFLEKGRYYAAYFNESVQGLDVDSPVKYRGVSVGRVDHIGVAPDSKLIEVILKIETAQLLETDIVAQLKAVGITGTMFVELDRKEPGEPDRSPALNFPTEYPVVSSTPSDISQILEGISEVIQHVKSIDLKGISDKTNSVLENANGLLADADMKGISNSLKASLQRINDILAKEKWDQILASLEDASHSLKSTLGKADRSLSRVENTVGIVDGMIEEERRPYGRPSKDSRRLWGMPIPC